MGLQRMYNHKGISKISQEQTGNEIDEMMEMHLGGL